MQKPKTNRLRKKQKKKKSENYPDPKKSALLNHSCYSAILLPR